MLNKIRKTISEFNMLNKGDNVLVALSGGADSVALLLCLNEIKKDLDLKIFACHCNHQLRGIDSDNDESFCKHLCDSLSVPLYTERLQVIAFSEETGKSIEEAARILRYKAFENAEKNFCITKIKIVTGHNLNDSIETMIFNLVRGTGLKGLCGIPPVRDNIIRPLINTSREEIEGFLKERNQNFVTDKTNFETDYTRNKIRLEVIPLLKKINPALNKTIERVQNNLRAENDFTQTIVNQVYNKCLINSYSLNIEILKYEHILIRNRCIIKLLMENKIEPDFNKIKLIDEIIFKDGKINLTDDIYIVSKDRTLSIIEIKNQDNHEFLSELFIGENDFLGIKKVNAEIISIENFNIINCVNKILTKNDIDYDKILGKVFLRNRRDGDRFILQNNDFSSSVKKLFNRSVPLNERSQRAFLCDDVGIIYIEGFGACDRVKADENTNNILRINIENVGV